jgi:hypothetical protein
VPLRHGQQQVVEGAVALPTTEGFLSIVPHDKYPTSVNIPNLMCLSEKHEGESGPHLTLWAHVGPMSGNSPTSSASSEAWRGGAAPFLSVEVHRCTTVEFMRWASSDTTCPGVAVSQPEICTHDTRPP